MDYEIYTKEGFPDWNVITGFGCTFNLILGGRGTGKTFSSLEWELENMRKFCFLRKNQVQADMVMTPEWNPFNPLNFELGYNIEVSKKGKFASVYNSNEYIGFMGALTAISGLRGFNAMEIQDIIYDEFIHEQHEKPLKGEFDATMNAYETINRNRELQGYEPVRLYLLANTNSLDSDILLKWNLIEIIRKMRKKGRPVWIDKARDILIVDMFASPISQKKKGTALYKATVGTDFYGMAVDNDFAYDRTDKVKSQPLEEFTLDIRVGELCFYKHKSRREYYISQHQKGTPSDEVIPRDEGKKRLKRKYVRYYKAHINNKVVFENMTCKILFEQYFN